MSLLTSLHIDSGGTLNVRDVMKLVRMLQGRELDQIREAYAENEEDKQALEERMAKALAKSQSTTLELLHDIPDADIAVPESDLFIYKLNPVTQDGDLEREHQHPEGQVPRHNLCRFRTPLLQGNCRADLGQD